MNLERIPFSAPLRGVVVDGRAVEVRESRISEPVPSVSTVVLEEPVAVAPIVPSEPVVPQEAIDAVSSALAGIQESIAEFERRRQQSLRELQKLAVELSFAVAEKLMRQQVGQSEFPIEELVAELLEKAGSDGPMTAFLHPEDLSLMKMLVEEDSSCELPSSLRLESDLTLERGSCRLIADQADIVSNLGQELEEFRLHVLLGLEDAEIERRQPEAAGAGVRRDTERRNAP